MRYIRVRCHCTPLDYGAKYLSDNARNVRVLSRTMLALGLDANVDFEAVANGKFTVRLFV
jgi:hypothetical protein